MSIEKCAKYAKIISLFKSRNNYQFILFGQEAVGNINMHLRVVKKRKKSVSFLIPVKPVTFR